MTTKGLRIPIADKAVQPPFDGACHCCRGNVWLGADKELADAGLGKPVLEDPIFRQGLGQAYIDTMVTKYHGLRSLNHLIRGGIPGPEGSVGKLLWSEFNQRICEAAINMQGPGGQLMSGSAWGIHDGYWQFHYLRSRGNTIEAGTSEIQRNIIGERVLELPKDMSRVNERQGG